jgi:hypothetical protein
MQRIRFRILSAGLQAQLDTEPVNSAGEASAAEAVSSPASVTPVRVSTSARLAHMA